MRVSWFRKKFENFIYKQVQARSQSQKVFFITALSTLMLIYPGLFQLVVLVAAVIGSTIAVRKALNPFPTTSVFEKLPPPVRGTKWDDYDSEMQDILRSYEGGEVKATGTHIADWNKGIRKRESTKRRALQAALDLKAARARARKRDSNDPLKAAMEFLRLPIALKFAQGRYDKAKKDLVKIDRGYTGNLIKKTKPGAASEQPESAIEKRDKEFEEALMQKLRTLKDEPISGEVLDNESQLGQRGASKLTADNTTYTRLWPKAIARSALMLGRNETSVMQSYVQEGDVDTPPPMLQTMSAWRKEREALKGAVEVPEPDKGMFKFFGSSHQPQKTLNLKGSRRFGIPTWVLVFPVVLSTFWVCLKLTWMGIRLAWGAFLSILCLNFGPLADVLDLYFLEAQQFVFGTFTGTLDNFQFLEIVLLTARDLFLDLASAILALLAPLLSSVITELPPPAPRASPVLSPPPIYRIIEEPEAVSVAGVTTAQKTALNNVDAAAEPPASSGDAASEEVDKSLWAGPDKDGSEKPLTFEEKKQTGFKVQSPQTRQSEPECEPKREPEMARALPQGGALSRVGTT